MNPKKEIEVKAYAKDVLETTNGLVSKEEIREGKENLLIDSLVEYYYLVGDKKSYPTNNEMTVEYDLDIILMSRARYNELKEIEANYLKLCN